MNNTQNITLENKNNTLLGQIFHLLADVADGKISLDDTIKQTTNDHKLIKVECKFFMEVFVTNKKFRGKDRLF